MRITNEFTVHTPIDRAWRVLTDLEGIAPCMPGARLTGVDGDVYHGKVRVKVGPVVSDFTGTARFTEKDDQAHRAAIDAKGRDARAAGNASALVTAVLRPEGDSTVVSVDTDLKISGKLAQFGSGMIKEVSGKLLGQFVTNLEAKLAAEDAGVTSTAAGSSDSDSTDSGSSASASSASASEVASADEGTERAAAPAGEPIPGTASAAAVETVPAAGVSIAPAGAPAPVGEPSGATPAEAAAATPVGLGASPATDADAVTPDAGAIHWPAGTPAQAVQASRPAQAAAARPSGAAATSPAGTPAAGRNDEPEPLDLLEIAGGSIYKRLVPLAVGVVVVGAVIVWFVARR